MSKRNAIDRSSSRYRSNVSVPVLFSSISNMSLSSSHCLYILIAPMAFLEAPADSSSLDGDNAPVRSSGIFGLFLVLWVLSACLDLSLERMRAKHITVICSNSSSSVVSCEMSAQNISEESELRFFQTYHVLQLASLYLQLLGVFARFPIGSQCWWQPGQSSLPCLDLLPCKLPSPRLDHLSSMI